CDGYVESTKPYRPYRMIYNEEQPDKSAAMRRERELKLSAGRKFLRSLIGK
ncbi:MAG TPA: endonuclease, partial [Bacteroidetes bacterium]|nr:endonuclease [Bacteroidota bacterium]